MKSVNLFSTSPCCERYALMLVERASLLHDDQAPTQHAQSSHENCRTRALTRTATEGLVTSASVPKVGFLALGLNTDQLMVRRNYLVRFKGIWYCCQNCDISLS